MHCAVRTLRKDQVVAEATPPLIIDDVLGPPDGAGTDVKRSGTGPACAAVAYK